MKVQGGRMVPANNPRGYSLAGFTTKAGKPFSDLQDAVSELQRIVTQYPDPQLTAMVNELVGLHGRMKARAKIISGGANLR